ncbi:hypothetical protein MJO28_016766 [Puccinia striiformis f. sp. tritici]|uniref:Uncharacterized protein n=1 Tax=Puccinia striiformis f. sp. tritici TaxID=168172 RepID=A0ACC0DQS3_9BASI|nr:hypothetical protein MJO28_016766 [Puccinia striiformis f. sp. tritici]
MAPVTRNGASSSNAGSPVKKPNGSLHKNAEVADTAGQLFGGSFTGPEAQDALNRILERSSQVDLTPQGDSGQPERGFGGLQEARDLPDSSNSALNVPMELDATLGGTSNPVSVLVVIRTWRKDLGSAQNGFHHRSRNMRDSVCWPKLTSANRYSLPSLQALADLDPTLQGSVGKEIPTPFTQVDFVQDGRSHEVGNPAASAKESHLSGVDLTGVGIAASETTLEAAQVPALSATATLEELKQMYTSYAATKELIEKSIEGHSGSTAPYLKVFMNTTLKGLNAFLVECKKRIDSADSNQDMDLSIIDLTLDDDELEVIRPLKRKRTPFSSIKFKKGAPASAPTPPVLKKLKIAASAPSAAPLFKPSTPPEVSGDSSDEIADEELEEVICAPNDSAARAQRTSPPPTPSIQPGQAPVVSPPPTTQPADQTQEVCEGEADREAKRVAIREELFKEGDLEEVFALPISAKGLLVSEDPVLQTLDACAVRSAIEWLKNKRKDVTQLFLPMIQPIMARKLVQYESNGGFKVASFKILKSSPELVLLSKQAKTKEFTSVIKCTPNLLQISAQDLFFHDRVINFANMKALVELKDKPSTEASWNTLIQLMMRSSTSKSESYHAEEKIIALAVNRLHSLLYQCLDPFHKNIPMDITAKDYDDELEESLTFICTKVDFLNTGAMATANVKGNGLHFLQKKMWETLVAMLLMQYSLWRDMKIKSLAVDPSKTKGVPAAAKRAVAADLAKKGKKAFEKESDIKDLWAKAGKVMTAKEWGRFRQTCMASAAVFFAFGPVGWWTGLNNINKYNNTSIWGVLNLAKHKHEYLKANEDTPRRLHHNSFKTDKPWENVEALMYSCFGELNIHIEYAREDQRPRVSWAGVTKIWEDKLEENVVLQAALVDMVKELSHPGTSLAYDGQQAQHIDLPANSFPMPKGVRADWGDMLRIAQGLPKRERGADEVDPEPKKKVKSAKKTTVPVAVVTPGSQVQVEDGPNNEEVDRMVNELGEHLDDTFPDGEQDGDQQSDNGEEDSDHGDEERGRRLAESQFILNSVSVAK